MNAKNGKGNATNLVLAGTMLRFDLQDNSQPCAWQPIQDPQEAKLSGVGQERQTWATLKIRVIFLKNSPQILSLFQF